MLPMKSYLTGVTVLKFWNISAVGLGSNEKKSFPSDI